MQWSRREQPNEPSTDEGANAYDTVQMNVLRNVSLRLQRRQDDLKEMKEMWLLELKSLVNFFSNREKTFEKLGTGAKLQSKYIQKQIIQIKFTPAQSTGNEKAATAESAPATTDTNTDHTSRKSIIEQ